MSRRGKSIKNSWLNDENKYIEELSTTVLETCRRNRQKMDFSFVIDKKTMLKYISH